MVIRAEERNERIWERHAPTARATPGSSPYSPPSLLDGMGRLYSVITLEPGCGVGLHKHEGDCETYFILSRRRES